MNNRKAKLLIAKPGQIIRISNRLVVRYSPSGLTRGWPTHYYGKNRKPSAAQNRRNNHGRYFL